MRRLPGSRLALAAIRGYQRWISPRKGYRCALCALTGGESCSNYGYRVIERFGLRRGLGLLDRRLALCGHVHRRAVPAAPMSPRPAVRNPWRHKEQGVCDLSCDLPGCDLGDLLGCGCDIADCGPSRCGPDRSRHRNTPQLDALARRIEERRRRRQS
jgi:putative component of membrane protein insertase Oxa1/YidC/SpoIIIJ protein YidD